jgi:hypothetical protein
MRDFVRTQLDLDDTDLPNALLDGFLQDGYDRAVGLENRWPFFEATWPATVDEQGLVLLPSDVRSVEMFMTSDGRLLPRRTGRWGISVYGVGSTGSSSTYWSEWAGQYHVVPATGLVQNVTVFGFRAPSDWISQGASAECDCDRRLHIPICWYACSLGYAQQEDEVLEQTYLNRFRESVTMARDDIMRAWSGSPKQFASVSYGSPYGPSTRQPQVVITPPSEPVHDGTVIGGTP